MFYFEMVKNNIWFENAKANKMHFISKNVPPKHTMLFYIFSCNTPIGNIEKVLKESGLSSQDAAIVRKKWKKLFWQQGNRFETENVKMQWSTIL